MRSERGNVTVLTVGFLAILGLLVVMVVNASAAFLERRELMNLADRVALHAADGLDRDRVYLRGITDKATLESADARALTAGIVPDDVSLRLMTSDDRVEVRVMRQTRLPLVPPGCPDTATVRAEASARLQIAP
ncbi:Tad domain-containing protein [Aeromicrobium tamlense]|uniref:Flp pilus assembly protein TadG n=1 Tax=Aeromicrobium tamlense TaxID=375541 RepID=A0A8I0KJW5_9ACTN|nr:pilus assembly protein TadG-related protein [Aeromicrobium tamlense]MBD1271717.1 Tad domain-containing protein [Aeromicrobium tamlense]NYI37535.1 Flp pilus assembly protein TadG [Aeromicrobium tamlense]